jgi:hypothetical protein
MSEELSEELRTAEDIVEKIMRQHWDMVQCNCWICRHGRAIGLRPRQFKCKFEIVNFSKVFR